MYSYPFCNWRVSLLNMFDPLCPTTTKYYWLKNTHLCVNVSVCLSKYVATRTATKIGLQYDWNEYQILKIWIISKLINESMNFSEIPKQILDSQGKGFSTHTYFMCVHSSWMPILLTYTSSTHSLKNITVMQWEEVHGICLMSADRNSTKSSRC